MKGFISCSQVLHANSLKNGVQLLGIRPEQLSLADLEGNKVQTKPKLYRP